MPAARPNLTIALRRLVKDIARRLPEFAHVRASRILIVAGEARRTSRATVRPLSSSGRPLVEIRGRRMLYLITLRPLFFRASTPEQRLETMLHELYHLSRDFDGKLESSRSHLLLDNRLYRRRLRPLVRRYLAVCPLAFYRLLSYDGEVMARQWLERPTLHGRKKYTEKQLFIGPLRMRTPKRKLHS